MALRVNSSTFFDGTNLLSGKACKQLCGKLGVGDFGPRGVGCTGGSGELRLLGNEG